MKKFIAALLAVLMCFTFVHADSNPTNYRIKINMAARTLKLYKDDNLMKEFPIAVGKPATKSPLGSFKIISKVINPWWGNHGNPMPPGPKNPLGIRWMGLSVATGSYGIHGNSTPSSIGTYASGGCIRMFNNDVEALFSIVPIGTPVQLVYENIELKQDKYTNTPVIIVHPNTYKLKTAEALVKKIKTENQNISEQQATKALKLASGSLKSVVAVSEGIPVLLNNQFVTNDAYVENGEIYVYYLAAADYFGLDSETVDSMDLKMSEKNGRIYTNLTDAASKMGGKLQYDKANNNIYFTANIMKINGAFLSSYNGGFDKEYSFSRALLQGIGTDIITVSNSKQAVNLKDFTKEKSWKLNVDSLYKTINIDIPLKVKAGDKYLSTTFWNGKYYLKYEGAASIPGIESQSVNLYEYNYEKYIDINELMQVYEYEKDSFSTVVEFTKPIDNKNTVQ